MTLKNAFERGVGLLISGYCCLEKRLPEKSAIFLGEVIKKSLDFFHAYVIIIKNTAGMAVL